MIHSKTALITGASTGIGKALAIIHAKQGGNLVIVARNEEKLKELKKELEHKYKVQVTIIVKDLSELNAPQQVYNEIKQRNIQIDYLMNNAGFGATSGMDKTAMFQKTATAHSVALDGYNGMLNGKIDVISGLQPMQKLMMASIPFVPKKMMLKQIRQMQEVS